MPSDDGRLTRLADRWISNPYASPPARATREDDELLQARAAPRLLELLAAKRTADAERWLLAVGHAQAVRTPDRPQQVLDEAVLPKKTQLPRPRADYVRVVMAAARCRRALDQLLGPSKAMAEARRDTWAACFGDSLAHALRLEQVIRDHDLLLFGETGTGKEDFARAIQAGTPGAADGGPAPSGAINAAAIPETLVESELFGHVKGAFTGATDTRQGRIRASDGGTFFLDEVGDLPLTTQVKLLRVIELDEVSPLGSDAAHTVDVRYVAATHRDLEAMVERREFRQDLYQRLAGNVLRLSPLRSRPEDIPAIGVAFVRAYLPDADDAVTERIDKWLRSPAAQGYAWPGNVRELQNAIRNLLLGIQPALPRNDSASGRSLAPVADALPSSIRDAAATEEEVKDWYLRRVLASVNGNYAVAARRLGIDRATIRRRARALGL